MPRPFMRQVVDALLPRGAAWRPAYGGHYDRLLDGAAENAQAVLDNLGSLEHIRNPYRCPVELLPGLEREFGITANNALTEKERRRSAAAVRYKQKALATAQKLQRALNVAGFGSGGYGLLVTPNSPAADPAPVADAPCAACLAAGDYFTGSPVYPQAGQICCRAVDGSDPQSGRECAGYYRETLGGSAEAEYKTPPEAYWPLLFYVGGTVTRNQEGRITAVAPVGVPAARRQELCRLILRIKPMGIWAVMLVRYV